jgi:hypothetical protein
MSEADKSPRKSRTAIFERAGKALESELEKGPGKQPSAYDVILANIETIHRMKAANFTDAEVLKSLASVGITIKLGTFGKYYSRAVAAAGKAKPRKTGRPARDSYVGGDGQIETPSKRESNPLVSPPSPTTPVANPNRPTDPLAAKPRGKPSLGFESKFDDE